MSQWFNLILKVAQPALKTLVYAGTNNLLVSVQEQLKKQQQQQVRQIRDSLNRGQKVQENQELVTAQAQLAELSYQGAISLQDTLEEITAAFTQTNLNFQQQRFYSEKVLQQQIFQERRASLLQLATYQRETTLRLPEVQKIFDYWPLKLFPSQLLASQHAGKIPPLKVFLTPLQLPAQQLTKLGLESPTIERRLAEGIRGFLSENYSWHSQVRPTEFLGGAWESKRFHGEASIKALFGMLKSEPTLILESEIEENTLYFRLGYWGLGQAQYYYQTIFSFQYRDFLLEAAKTRAKEWQNTYECLVTLGKNSQEIANLGGERAHNLMLLAEEERLIAAGIEPKNLHLAYQISSEDLEALCQFLITCHSLVAGWIIDIYYLIHDEREPILPELLPSLMTNYSEQEMVREVWHTTVSLYQEVIQAVVRERPYWLPELSLKLASSLTYLNADNLAQAQLEYSWQNWLQQRQLESEFSEQDLTTFNGQITARDREYLENLQVCCSRLGEHLRAERLQICLESLKTERKKTLQFSLREEIGGLEEAIFSLQLSHNGQSLVSSSDRSLLVWEHNSSQFQHSYKLTSAPGIIFCRTAREQILISSDQTDSRSYIKIWNLQTRKLEKTLFGHKKPLHALLFNAQQQTLASAGHKIKLWNLQTGEATQTLFGHREGIYALAMSVDGQILVSGSKDRTIRIWKLPQSQLLYTLTGHQGCVRTLALSADDQYLISGSDDQTIKVWELATGKLQKTIKAHDGIVYTLTISADGQYLISGSEDQTIKVWRLPELELVQTLSAHTAAVRALSLSPDGKTLVTGGEDQTIKIWQGNQG